MNAPTLGFLLQGYLFTIAIETLILIPALSPRHPLRRRLFLGVWLTACTYPIVVLSQPLLEPEYGRLVYLTVVETFAPAAECALLLLAFGAYDESGRATWPLDGAAVIVANLASFGLGEWLYSYGWDGYWFHLL